MALIDYKALQIGEAVGHGGFAEVYKATYQGQVVAVKQWKFDAEQLRPEQRELFVRETQINAELQHPNIVRFIGYTNEPLCIIMEYVPGVHLFRVCNDRRIQYNWRVILRLAQEIVLGLQHIHSKNVIHRDFKSSNVIVTNEWHVKICDFGLARTKVFAEKLTGGRGTVHWMAPEVIEHQDYDFRADIYSFGVILWEMVARYQPYLGEKNLMKVAERVARAGLRPAIPSFVPPRYSQLIQRCWAHDPATRPGHEELMRELASPDFIPAHMLDQYIPHPSQLQAGAPAPAPQPQPARQ